MAELQIPLLSLGAEGPLGNVVSFDKRLGQNRVRTKPIPTDPKSLAQMYQRWEYQDYIALWHDLSVADKQTWESKARRYHITGFAYWMRSNLRNRTDIRGLWHMDYITAATVKDFSPYGNHAAVLGPSLTDGIIDGALYFDGIDDRLNAGTDPSLRFTSEDFSVWCIFRLDEIDKRQIICFKVTQWTAGWKIEITPGNGVKFDTYQAAAAQLSATLGIVQADRTYRLAVTRQGAVATIFLDGEDVTNVHGNHIDPDPTDEPFMIGRRKALHSPLHGIIDHFEVKEGILPSDLLIKRNERRYPL